MALIPAGLVTLWTPDQVAAGPVPGNPDVLLQLSGGNVGQLYATPYWRAVPWPQVLTSCAELALWNGY